MTIEEIAKELAVACLSHRDVAASFGGGGAGKGGAAEAGEKVGAFYNAIWKALRQEPSASTKAS